TPQSTGPRSDAPAGGLGVCILAVSITLPSPGGCHPRSPGWQGAQARRKRSVSMDHTRPDPPATESFPTDPSGLPEAGRPELLELGPGDTLELTVGPVAKRLGAPTEALL